MLATEGAGAMALEADATGETPPAEVGAMAFEVGATGGATPAAAACGLSLRRGG